jgi:uncharacterized membrane protein
MTDVRLEEPGLDLGKWLAGAAAGALLMYVLDPDRGSARRGQAADAVRNAGNRGSRMLGDAWDSIGSRFSSTTANATDTAAQVARSARAAVAGESVTDTMTRIGRNALAAVGDTMPGATRMASKAASRVRDAVQAEEWTPAARGTAIVGGGLLGMYGLMRRNPLGWALGLAGVAMLARGAFNQPLRSMLGAGALDQAIDLEKSIQIDASPEEVYDFWSNYENFPRFMSHVAEVRDLGRGRSHWVVRGPGDSKFEWNSKLTEQSPPHRLAWRTEPGAEIAQAGSVQFEPYRGGTRATVRMSYWPPAGAIGHGIATVLGVDPKRQMDDDLARMKTCIERGELPPEQARQNSSLLSRFLH